MVDSSSDSLQTSGFPSKVSKEKAVRSRTSHTKEHKPLLPSENLEDRDGQSEQSCHDWIREQRPPHW